MPLSVLAVGPTVDSFSASPTYASYAIGSQLSWSVSGGNVGGPEFYFSCPTGVSVKAGGGTFACNTATSLGSSASGSAGVSFINLTGSDQTVSVRITPKDLNNVAYADNVRTIQLTAATVPQPITDFSSSSSTPASGAPVTLSWTGVETPGVNFQFYCGSDIKVLTEPSNPRSSVACGQMAFTSDLPRSGSQTFTFVNSSFLPADISVRIIPSVVAGSYDGVHGVSLTLSVRGKEAAAVASVPAFSASTLSPVSGAPVTFSWTAANTDNTNLQFSCASSLSIAAIVGTSSTPLPCGTPAFATDFPLVSSTIVAFTNSGIAPVPVTALLLPKTNGTYDAIHARSLSLSVLVPGTQVSTAPVSAPTTPSTSSTTVTPTASGGGAIKAVRTITFSVAMAKGSRGAQVSALQQFLAEDPSLYPEGLVTGYFGSASEAALKRFQVRYGIANTGDAGYGLVGPKTRAKLNSISTF